MQHKMLKLSTLAILIAGATGANAAVYKVVEVPADSAVGSQDYYGMNTADTLEVYGQGITQSAAGDNCFDSSGTGTCNLSSYTVFGESRLGTDGVSYRDEIPYLTDSYQHAIDYDGIYRYCTENLNFNTCDVWAEARYYGKNYDRNNVVKGRVGFGGLQREQAAWSRSYSANAYPLVDGFIIDTFATNQTPIADAGLGARVVNSSNAVVNGIVDDIPFGNASSSFFANSVGKYVREFDKRGFVKAPAANVELLSAQAVTGSETEKALVTKMGQTLAWDAVEYPVGSGTLLIVGSGSFSPSDLDDSDKLPDTDDVDIGVGVSSSTFSKCASEYSTTSKTLFDTYECQFSVFANDAMFWSFDPNIVSDTEVGSFIAKTTLTPEDPNNDRSAQASARAIEIITEGNDKDKPVAVGYSTEARDGNEQYYPRATIFTPNSTTISEGDWSKKFIPDTEIENNDGDIQYSYSTATGINANNKVIGITKNYRAENRSFAQKMFVFDNVAGKTKFLDTSIDSTIFFDGSNGYTAAINNHDVVVGWVDSETVNQVDGRERRQRAFLFNDGAAIANSPLSANGAWMLDNLTNDNGDKSAVANQFRIAQATGINDAGVISATALQCAGGYDNLTSESQCSGGERLVAVKLVPIPDGTVQVRPEDSSTVERSGASLGMFALTLLGLFGFRRRK